jgi:glycolate oxidase
MDKDILKKIEKIVGKTGYTLSPIELRAYAADAGIHLHEPEVVVRPRTTQEVSEVLKLANEHKIPVTPRGAGTALCGHAVPIKGGIVLDLQAMNKIKEVHVEDFYVVVEPGVIYAELNAHLKPHKFFFPPAPGSGDVANIGGMVAANASGVNAVKYGATRDYVLGCEIVLPTGEIIHSGTRTLKDSSGFQLARLMVASEGMLGVITEINLRVVPLPEKNALAMAVFDDVEKAGQCVSDIIAHPLIPHSLEIMDNICIQAVNKATGLGLPEVEGILLIGVSGHPEAVKDEIEIVAEVAKKAGAVDVNFTEDPKEIAGLQKGRKAMIPSLSRFKEGMVTVMLADDMAVPPSQVAKAVKAFHEIQDRYDGIYIPTYGHAGDGNLHTKFIIDPTDADVWERAEKANEEVFDAVLGQAGDHPLPSLQDREARVRPGDGGATEVGDGAQRLYPLRLLQSGMPHALGYRLGRRGFERAAHGLVRHVARRPETGRRSRGAAFLVYDVHGLHAPLPHQDRGRAHRGDGAGEPGQGRLQDAGARGPCGQSPRDRQHLRRNGDGHKTAGGRGAPLPRLPIRPAAQYGQDVHPHPRQTRRQDQDR